jgi:hypothetical protein
MALYGAETWTLRAVDQKHLESFEIWCWRRMEISWTDHLTKFKTLQLNLSYLKAGRPFRLVAQAQAKSTWTIAKTVSCFRFLERRQKKDP